MSKLFNSIKPIHNSALLIPVAAGAKGEEEDGGGQPGGKAKLCLAG